MLKIYKKLWLAVRNYYNRNLREWMQKTSMHGLKFVADDKLLLWERGFFLCCILVAFTCAALFVEDLYASWNRTPIIVGISPQPTSIRDIPFPALVICNMNVIQRSKIVKYPKNSVEMFLTRFLCDMTDREEIRQATKFENTSWTIRSFLSQHTQSCEEMLLDCFFGMVYYNCSELFQHILTNDGSCCVFNFLDHSFFFRPNASKISMGNKFDIFKPVDWNPEKGYAPTNYTHYFPMRGIAAGLTLGVRITLNASTDDYFCSQTNGAGFKFGSVNPLEIHTLSSGVLSIPIGTETQFRLTAEGTEAAPEIRKLDKKIRKCLFNDEKQLIAHRHYSMPNCLRECEALHHYEKCGCLKYHMPLINPNATECGIPQIMCMLEATDIMRNPPKKWKKCQDECLDSCHNIRYSADGFSLPFYDLKYTTLGVKETNFSEIQNNIALVRVYYSATTFHTEIMNIYIGLTDFLSNSGGVLSLFMGFSVISIAEIIYYTLLRPICVTFFLPFLRKHNDRITPVIKMTAKNNTELKALKPRKAFGRMNKNFPKNIIHKNRF